MSKTTTIDCTPLLTASDLTEQALAIAIETMRVHTDDNLTLVVPEAMAFQAGYICGLYENGEKYEHDITVVFLPLPMVKDLDSWFVTDGKSAIWSPGA